MNIPDKLNKDAGPCCPAPEKSAGATGLPGLTILPLASGPAGSGCCDSEKDQPCCGPPPAPPSSPHERPGYILCTFVEDFVDTAMGPVPIVSTSLDGSDRFGTFKTRLNIGRGNYKVAPGLYGVGHPGPESPVIVTANYKLTFDAVRSELRGVDGWILVLDTRGINVWCAAGKGTLSTSELVLRVKKTGLDRIVNHRRLLLPQLGATGIAGHRLRKECGFEPVWGPIRAGDIKEFLARGMKGDEKMRRVTFSVAERAVLVPVEISLVLKPSLWVLLCVFLLSGFGPGVFSLSALWQRGVVAVLAYGAGIGAGAVLVPVLLPWLPGRAFFIKGIFSGLAVGGSMVYFFNREAGAVANTALVLLALAVSSYAAMNFTGATPYTSPTGVEKEMRLGIPIQIIATLAAAVLWVWSAFLN